MYLFYDDFFFLETNFQAVESFRYLHTISPKIGESTDMARYYVLALFGVSFIFRYLRFKIKKVKICQCDSNNLNLSQNKFSSFFSRHSYCFVKRTVSRSEIVMQASRVTTCFLLRCKKTLIIIGRFRSLFVALFAHCNNDRSAFSRQPLRLIEENDKTFSQELRVQRRIEVIHLGEWGGQCPKGSSSRT